jgi:hypothetical protein
MNFLTILIITIAFLAFFFIGLGIKMFLKKGGEFKKQCSVKDPETGKSLGCSCGGNENSCHND